MLSVGELKELKKKNGYTNEMIAEMTGVPLSTVQKVAFKPVSFMSARLNNVYIVQWLLIAYTYAVFQLTGINLPAAGVIPASIVIMVLSGFIANLYIKIRDRKKNANKQSTAA